MWVEATAATLLGLLVVAGMERREQLLPSATVSVLNLHVTYMDRNGTLQAITGA